MLAHRRSLALNPAATDVPMFGGQDSGVDPRVLQPGSNAVVENGRLSVRGQVRKRYGFTNVATNDITQGEQVFSGGSVLFHHDGDQVRTYNQQLDTWTNIGRMAGGQLRTLGVVQSATSVSQVSSAVVGDLMLVAWREGTNSLYYCVVDITTGAQLIPRLAITTGVSPEVLSIGTNFYIFYVDTSSSNVVKMIKVDAATAPISALGAVQVGDNIVGGQTDYDVAVNTAGNGFIAAIKVAPLNYTVYSLNTSGATLVSVTGQPAAAGQSPSVFPVPQNIAGTALGGVSADNTRVFLTNGNIFTMTASPPMPLRRATAVGNSFFGETHATTANSVSVVIPYTFTYDPTTSPGSQYAIVSTGAPIINQMGVHLSSRAFAHDTNTYVGINVDDQLQSVDMIADSKGAIVAIAGANGGQAPGTGFPSLAYIKDNGSGDFDGAFRYLTTVQVTDTGAVQQTTTGITMRRFSLGTKHIYAEQIDNVTYLGCSAPQIFDGAQLTEWGFYFYPQITNPVPIEPSGGSLTGGLYDVSACYVWYDATGKAWRSATSFFAEVTVPTTGGADGSIQVTVPYLWQTNKTNVQIEIYCSANIGGQTGSILYRVATIANQPPVLNPTTGAVVTASTATYTITMADKDIAKGLQLYTNGGAPDHITPPSLVHMSSSGLRMYGCCNEDNQVYVTSPAIPGQPLDFLFTQSVAVESRRGGLVASQPQDGNLWIATQRAWFLTNADVNTLGITNAGNVILFSPPARAAFGDGCASAESVYPSTDGIYYQSSRGIEIITRNQQAVFVGEPVKNITGTILDVFSVPSQQQIRFVYPDRMVCYDYERRNWVQHTFQSMDSLVSGCAWNALGVALTPDGIARLENTSTFFDDRSVPIVMKLETPWLRLGGLAGWGKAWEFVVLGEQITACNMQVRIAYNDDPTWIDTLNIPSSVIGAPFGGGNPPQGPWGNQVNQPNPPKGMFGNNPAGNAYKWLGIIPRADGNSFKFEFQTLNSGGEDIRLNYLTLIYGLQPGGTAQFPTARKFG